MIKKIFPLFPVEFGVFLLILFLVSTVGCSKRPDAPYDYGKGQPTKSPGSGKSPPTQRPYTIKGKQYTPMASAQGYVEEGIASWYGKKFHGRKTSNGETYNMYALTAAHKTLPMGTWVKVYNRDTRQELIVRINDRGPYVNGRILDLSRAAAAQLGMVDGGLSVIQLEVTGDHRPDFVLNAEEGAKQAPSLLVVHTMEENLSLSIF